jgi:hypothetical protein
LSIVNESAIFISAFLIRSQRAACCSGMVHDNSHGASNNVLLLCAPRFRHAVAQT